VSAFTIRPALVSDSEEIHECLRVAFANFLDSYSREAFLILCRRRERRQRFYVHVAVCGRDAERKVIGTIAYYLKSPEEGYIRGMAVFPRGKARVSLSVCWKRLNLGSTTAGASA